MKRVNQAEQIIVKFGIKTNVKTMTDYHQKYQEEFKRV